MPSGLQAGTVPPQEYAEGTPDWCTWHVNCIGFERRQGLSTAVRQLLGALQTCASNLGFSAAAGMTWDSEPTTGIMRFLDMLPRDRIHFMLVCGMQR